MHLETLSIHAGRGIDRSTGAKGSVGMGAIRSKARRLPFLKDDLIFTDTDRQASPSNADQFPGPGAVAIRQVLVSRHERPRPQLEHDRAR